MHLRSIRFLRATTIDVSVVNPSIRLSKDDVLARISAFQERLDHMLEIGYDINLICFPIFTVS